jgi:hypothetical protein
VNNSVYSSSYGTIGGGYQNTVNRSSLSLTPEAGGTVPGGEYNWAGGFCAFAAGFHANSLHDGTFVWADDSSSANFSSTGNNQFLIRAQGGVGIGTASPDAQLTVNGTADKPGGGSWGTYSDARLKDVGANFTHGMAALAAIQPVHYHYKSDNPLHLPSQPDYVGVVAQQVQSAIPEAVQQNKAGYLVVNNDPIIWTMFNAIKELNQQREAETKAKDAEIAELKARLAELEQLMTEKTGGDK